MVLPAEMEVKAIKPSEKASGGVIGEGGGPHEPHLPNAFGPFQDPGHVHTDPTILSPASLPRPKRWVGKGKGWSRTGVERERRVR